MEKIGRCLKCNNCVCSPLGWFFCSGKAGHGETIDDVLPDLGAVSPAIRRHGLGEYPCKKFDRGEFKSMS